MEGFIPKEQFGTDESALESVWMMISVITRESRKTLWHETVGYCILKRSHCRTVKSGTKATGKEVISESPAGLETGLLEKKFMT